MEINQGCRALRSNCGKMEGRKEGCFMEINQGCRALRSNCRGVKWKEERRVLSGDKSGVPCLTQ